MAGHGTRHTRAGEYDRLRARHAGHACAYGRLPSHASAGGPHGNKGARVARLMLLQCVTDSHNHGHGIDLYLWGMPALAPITKIACVYSGHFLLLKTKTKTKKQNRKNTQKKEINALFPE